MINHLALLYPKVGVTPYNFLCPVALEKEIHRKLHDICCNLGLQLAMFSKSLQMLEQVEWSSSLCSCCKPKIVAR